MSRIRNVLAALILSTTSGHLILAQPAGRQEAAQALLQAGKFAEAREAFESTLESDPTSAEAQEGEVAASEQLALQARAAGKMKEALEVLLRAQGFAPKNPRLLLDLGILEDEMRLFQQADVALAAAEQLAPDNPEIIYGVARVKLDLGNLSVAETKMTAYLKLRPDDASAHYGLGRIYQMGLQFDKAKAEFEHSIDLQPLQTESYYQLGDIALKQSQLNEAITMFAKVTARDPSHGGALEGTGEAYFKLKDYKQAEAYLHRAITAAPGYPPSHYYLGLTLARLGRSDDAKKELAESTRLSEDAQKKSVMQLKVVPPGQNQ